MAAAVPAALAWLVVRATGGGVAGAYGGEINIPPQARNPLHFLEFVWQFYLPRLPFMTPRIGPHYGFRSLYIEGGFGRFGALETGYTPGTNDLIEFAVLIGAALLIATVISHRELLVPRWDVVVLLAACGASLVLFLHFASYRALSTQPDPVDPLIVARYLLPLTPLFAVAIAFVAGAWRRAGPYVAVVALSIGAFLQISSLGLVLSRFYG
jgi:hypothetical protein